MWESFKQKKQTTPYSDVVDLIGKIESEFSINNSNDDIRERAHECIKTLYSIATKTKAPEIP